MSLIVPYWTNVSYNDRKCHNKKLTIAEIFNDEIKSHFLFFMCNLRLSAILVSFDSKNNAIFVNKTKFPLFFIGFSILLNQLHQITFGSSYFCFNSYLQYACCNLLFLTPSRLLLGRTNWNLFYWYESYWYEPLLYDTTSRNQSPRNPLLHNKSSFQGPLK